MFGAMKEGIREETVGFLFHIEVELEDEEEPVATVSEGGELTAAAAAATASQSPLVRARGLDAPKAPSHLTYSAPAEGGEVEVTAGSAADSDDPFAGVSRNQLCPCGSGKKYKRCHGAPNGPTGQVTRAGG